MTVLGRKDNPIEKKLLKEKNDCTVRALANALEIQYIEAYGMMIGAGRKARKGFNSRPLYNSLGQRFDRPGMTVANYVKFVIPAGNWIVEIKGHVFAVVNGVVIDEYPNVVANCHVISSWKVK